MSAKFTRGPWTAHKHGVIVAGPAIEYINGSAQAQIAMVCVRFDAESAEAERDANAALIAAAPDMYAALCDALEFFEISGAEKYPVADKARAAIAKAVAK